MRKLCVLLLIGLLVGCGVDHEPAENGDASVGFVGAIPPSGLSIAPNSSITLIFDSPPENVTANAGIVTAIGNVVIISGPFAGDILLLVVTWLSGTVTLIYFISHVD